MISEPPEHRAPAMLDEIAEFYDRHPYPPPIADLDAQQRVWTDQRRRVERLRLWPRGGVADDRSILVAGCGTSQAAKFAVRYPDATVVGIDVSTTSIAETQRLADRHGVGNLQLHELPIEEVATLGRRFDHVVSTGVLHHLADPAAGFSALRDVLEPHGALEAMVYAPFGRTGVYLLQEYSRMLGLQPRADHIADLVATLRELPLGHPLGHLLRSSPDFADDDALADALLNPRDRAYAVPQLFELLDAVGLSFGRWVRQAPYRPQCGIMRELPHGARLAALPEREQFAAMELFRGTMVRHGFVAYRSDASPASLVFHGDEWRNYVPVRSTTSTLVSDKVPRGAAAALLDRAHTSADLVWLATTEERRAFERIDGHRTMADIGADGAFFQRLWFHDLIVVGAPKVA